MATKEQQLIDMLKPVVESLGYEFWGLEYVSQGKNSVLCIYIESENGINVDDCANVSRQASAVLDVEDPISSEYNLEVSSPGLDRPLFTLDQFQRNVGEFVEVRLRYPFEGRRNFKGRLVAVEGEDAVVHVDDHEYLLPVEGIDKANVIYQFNKDKK
ncbi:MAG: ribosome maturation factor RimP [Oceanospirillaceae bacterium]|nr:ribosome maturation factor RimP [Oceanospirillaceae bacterium]MCP5335569.1 ribosome maturation factor RimP [Oceanospirillaceae bacterium]MCP5350201.1 ribosome maturation factor RimP [Oceanospirillaceae bacterium]